MTVSTEWRLAPYAATSRPAEPPTSVWPTTKAPPVVQHPVATREATDGAPSGLYGKPWARFGREVIGVEGFTFYESLFPAGAHTVRVKCQLFDRHTGTWNVYAGWLHRPTYADETRGGYRFLNFRVLVTKLVRLGQWSDMPLGAP